MSVWGQFERHMNSEAGHLCYTSRLVFVRYTAAHFALCFLVVKLTLWSVKLTLWSSSSKAAHFAFSFTLNENMPIKKY